jgi:transcriptional regulator with XRE-family HTH domain
MKFKVQDSDAACLQELGERLARLRLNRNQTQAALAREAGVSLRTVVRMEQGESVQLTNLLRVLRALGLLENLEVLIPEPAESPLQQLKRQGRIRRRASSHRESAEPAEDAWSWGEEP